MFDPEYGYVGLVFCWLIPYTLEECQVWRLGDAMCRGPMFLHSQEGPW